MRMIEPNPQSRSFDLKKRSDTARTAPWANSVDTRKVVKAKTANTRVLNS